MEKQIPFHIHVLRSELDKRIEKNASYSLRSFAKNLAIDAASLSSVLKGQRSIAKKKVKAVATKLDLSPKEINLFVNSNNMKALFQQETNKLSFQLDDEVHFKIISEWQHYGILSLFETKNFPKKHTKKDLQNWVADRLGITKSKAQACLENLLQSNLIRHENNQWFLTQSGMSTTEDITSSALRKARKQDLLLAEKAIEEVQTELRDMSSITMTVNLDDLIMLKKQIRSFRKKFEQLAEAQAGSEVYKLNLQFFPITKLTNKGAKNEK